MKRRALLSLVLASSILAACGGKGRRLGVRGRGHAARGSYALLPSGAVSVARLDAKALFASQGAGGEAARLGERYLPIGEEAGFVASRDLDTVVAGAYSTQGADVAAVLKGRFDEAKIRDAAEKHTPLRGGGQLVASSYAGRNVYTLSNVGFTVLSSTTVIAGTETGIRRVLDRVAANRVTRDMQPWMLQTLETADAHVAFAADLANQPMGAPTQLSLPLGFLQGLKSVRLLATFKEPGLVVAGALTYPDANTAQAASQELRKAAGMSQAFALLGLPQLRDVKIDVAQTDVQLQFAADDAQLRSLVKQAPQWIGAPPAAAATPDAPLVAGRYPAVSSSTARGALGTCPSRRTRHRSPRGAAGPSRRAEPRRRFSRGGQRLDARVLPRDGRALRRRLRADRRARRQLDTGRATRLQELGRPCGSSGLLAATFRSARRRRLAGRPMGAWWPRSGSAAPSSTGAPPKSRGPDGPARRQALPGARLRGPRYSHVTSAQVKSALLLAGLYADGPTVGRRSGAIAPSGSRRVGARARRRRAVRLDPAGWARQPSRLDHVPGDLSAAAFVLWPLRRAGSRVSVRRRGRPRRASGDLRHGRVRRRRAAATAAANRSPTTAEGAGVRAAQLGGRR